MAGAGAARCQGEAPAPLAAGGDEGRRADRGDSRLSSRCVKLCAPVGSAAMPSAGIHPALRQDHPDAFNAGVACISPRPRPGAHPIPRYREPHVSRSRCRARLPDPTSENGRGPLPLRFERAADLADEAFATTRATRSDSWTGRASRMGGGLSERVRGAVRAAGRAGRARRHEWHERRADPSSPASSSRPAACSRSRSSSRSRRDRTPTRS